MPLAAQICLVTEDVQEEEGLECGSRPGAVQLIAIVAFSKVPQYSNIFRRMQEARIQSDVRSADQDSK